MKIYETTVEILELTHEERKALTKAYEVILAIKNYVLAKDKQTENTYYFASSNYNDFRICVDVIDDILEASE